jgi:hypothetical protein
VIQFAAAPEGIGPHEDRELELMLAGTKPLAMFGDALGSSYAFPEADFAPYVADGTVVRREMIYRPQGQSIPTRYVYFACAGEEWRIDAMHRIHERIFERGEGTSAETEREIGQLLGYAESEINAWLTWIGTHGFFRK